MSVKYEIYEKNKTKFFPSFLGHEMSNKNTILLYLVFDKIDQKIKYFHKISNIRYDINSWIDYYS